MAYDDHSRQLVLKFKHADRTESAPAVARWLARAGAEFLDDADVICPVPLHRWRLLKRRYNQSALLVNALRPLVRSEVVPDLLLRTRATSRFVSYRTAARSVTIYPPRSISAWRTAIRFCASRTPARRSSTRSGTRSSTLAGTA